MLVAGGYANNNGDSILSSTDLYDPVSKSFTAGPSMNDQRGLAAAALLRNGDVLIAGGASGVAGIQSTTDLYRP